MKMNPDLSSADKPDTINSDNIEERSNFFLIYLIIDLIDEITLKRFYMVG